MKGIIRYIKQHLYMRMGLEILLILVGVFSVALGILFYQSRQLVQDAAMSKANKTLDETMLHISDIMDRTEKATADLEKLAQENLKPDSLLTYTRRMLEEYPNILGVTIALEPDYFPEYGRYFSASAFHDFALKALPFALIGILIPHLNWCLHLYALCMGYVYGRGKK